MTNPVKRKILKEQGTKVFSCHWNILLLTFLQVLKGLNSNTWVIYSQKDSRTGIHFFIISSPAHSPLSPCGSQSFYYKNSVTQSKKKGHLITSSNSPSKAKAALLHSFHLTSCTHKSHSSSKMLH